MSPEIQHFKVSSRVARWKSAPKRTGSAGVGALKTTRSLHPRAGRSMVKSSTSKPTTPQTRRPVGSQCCLSTTFIHHRTAQITQLLEQRPFGTTCFRRHKLALNALRLPLALLLSPLHLVSPLEPHRRLHHGSTTPRAHRCHPPTMRIPRPKEQSPFASPRLSCLRPYPQTLCLPNPRPGFLAPEQDERRAASADGCASDGRIPLQESLH